jgi:hypothetical protein
LCDDNPRGVETSHFCRSSREVFALIASDQQMGSASSPHGSLEQWLQSGCLLVPVHDTN